MRNYRRWVLLVCLSFLLTGCGSGGLSDLLGGNPLTTLLSLVISWQLRSRDITAPASALSATVVLKGAKPGGGDFTFTFDRDSNLAAHSQAYVSPSPVLTGTWDATITFYAQQGGQGAVVGVASKQATIDVTSNNLGNISTTGTITSVTIPSGQEALVGLAQDLTFTARDANGNIVAVSPGSAIWTVVNGSDKVQVTSNGQLQGVAIGTATLSVSVDGVSSPVTAISVAPSLSGGM